MTHRKAGKPRPHPAGFLFVEACANRLYSHTMILLAPTTNRLFTGCGVLLALSLFTIALFGFYPFHAGSWNAEPIMLAMLTISALMAFWLAMGVFLGWITIRLPHGNPLLTLWLCWIGWQCIVTVLSPTPWRSWFGPPEQAEGLAWYLCASIFMLLLGVLWRLPFFRTVLISYSFAVMLILTFFHLSVNEPNNMFGGLIFSVFPGLSLKWLPFVWPDYLGYMAAWWWLAFMIVFPHVRLRIAIAAGIMLLVVLLASSNRGAFTLVSYAVSISLTIRIIHAYGLPYFRQPSTLWKNLVMAVLLLPLLWLLGSPYIKTSYKGDVTQSIPTRILLNHISLTAIADHPARLLTGKGWGQCADDFYRYSVIRDIRIYDNGVHEPNWNMVRGYNYHTHNMASQTLLSLGLVGFLLWLSMPLVAIRRLPAGLFWQVSPTLVAVTYLSHLWFTMPQTMPFQALCWFLLMKQESQRHQERLLPFLPVGLFVAGAAMAWSSFAQWEAIQYSTRLSDPFGQRDGKALTAEFMEEDIRRGGDRLRTFFINTTKRLTQNERQVTPKHVTLYAAYLDSVEAMAKDPHIGAYNMAAVLYGYNSLITTLRNPLFKDLQQRASRNYYDFALLQARRAPYREDTIAPFLMALYESPRDLDHRELMNVVHDLLAINPAHRSALWLGGKVLSAQKGMEAQGQEMMRVALMLGADRVFPIKRSEVDAVKHSPL